MFRNTCQNSESSLSNEESHDICCVFALYARRACLFTLTASHRRPAMQSTAGVKDAVHHICASERHTSIGVDNESRHLRQCLGARKIVNKDHLQGLCGKMQFQRQRA